jgi:hypothetical protein
MPYTRQVGDDATPPLASSGAVRTGRRGHRSAGARALLRSAGYLRRTVAIAGSAPVAVRGIDGSCETVEPEGVVRSCGPSAEAPFSAADCVAYCYEVGTRSNDVHYAEPAFWTTERGQGGVPFVLEDDTGRALVDPEGATMLFADGDGITPYDTERARTEYTLQEGDEVHVYGTAYEHIEAHPDRQASTDAGEGEGSEESVRFSGREAEGDGGPGGGIAVGKSADETGQTGVAVDSETVAADAAIGDAEGTLFHISSGDERATLRRLGWKAAVNSTKGTLAVGIPLWAVWALL